MAEINVGPKLGTPEAFGLAVRTTRAMYQAPQKLWASQAGIDQSVLSRLEGGKHPLPGRDQVIYWTTAWGLQWNEQATILISGGNLPVLDPIPQTDYDNTLVSIAIRETLGRIPRLGVIEVWLNRAQQLEEMGQQLS